MKKLITVIALATMFGPHTVHSDSDYSCGIKFNPEAEKISFDHQPTKPLISANSISDVEYAHQTLTVTLKARYGNQNTLGISGGSYQKRITNNGGVTWSAWTSQDFQHDDDGSKVEWYRNDSDDKLAGKESASETLRFAEGTDEPVYNSFKMKAVFNTAWDAKYLEDRTLVGEHVSVTSDESDVNYITVYIYDGVKPSGCSEDTFRTWQLPNEPWKLYRKGVHSWNVYNDPSTLPAAAD